MEHLNVADWLVITVYLAGIIALGVWFGKDQRNTRDYFLGSRNVSWWAIGFSIVATETSALTVIGVPGLAFGGDLGFLQMIVGYVLARIILAAVLVPHYFKGEIYSPYQLLADRFGPSARRTAGGFFLLSETLAAGVRVYVVAIPLQLMLGIPVLPAILLFVGLSLIYTYVGGVKAVIWTDAVQFVLFLAGGLYTLWYLPTLLDGGWQGVWRTAGEAGKLEWFNPAFTLGAPYTIWMGLIGGTVMVLSSHGAEQLIVQRVLACKTVRDGRRALILSAALIFPMFLIFLLVGAFLWVYYQAQPMAIPLPEAQPGIQANDFVYPIFMLTEVPQVLRGFLIVALLAAAMSSVSSALSALASVSTMDFLKVAWPRRSEAVYLKWSKLSTLFWAGLLILVGYLSRQVALVLDAAFSLRGLTSGALLGAVIMAVFLPRGSPRPIVIGMLSALAVMLVIKTQTAVFWPWYTLIGTTVCLGVTFALRQYEPASRASA
jgi:solute:Na+ symporter, SSS family